METIQGSEPQLRVPSKPYLVTPLGYPAEMLGPKETYERVSDQITEEPLRHPHQKAWLVGFTIAFLMLVMLGVSLGY